MLEHFEKINGRLRPQFCRKCSLHTTGSTGVICLHHNAREVGTTLHCSVVTAALNLDVDLRKVYDIWVRYTFDPSTPHTCGERLRFVNSPELCRKVLDLCDKVPMDLAHFVTLLLRIRS